MVTATTGGISYLTVTFRVRWLTVLGVTFVLTLALLKEHDALIGLRKSQALDWDWTDTEAFNTSQSSLKEFDAWNKLSRLDDMSEESADDDAIESSQRSSDTFACIWGPDNDEPCVELVANQIKASLRSLHSPPLHHRRWLLLGDSTTSMMWARSPLQDNLNKYAKIKEQCPHYDCPNIWTGRCNVDEPLSIPRPEVWTPPNYTLAEGPVHNGVHNHFCHDCNGCSSQVMSCVKKGDDLNVSDLSVRPSCPSSGSTRQAMYGAFIAVEFARDVEFQSAKFLTTQESILHYYVDQFWNTDELVKDFGRPICIVCNGFHDMGIPGVTLDSYLDSVQWYTNLLLASCDHIVWLGNNAPQTDKFAQKHGITLEWNNGVRDFLMTEERTSFIDVFNASVDYTHSDNIHMGGMWYHLLGSMFLKIFAS